MTEKMTRFRLREEMIKEFPGEKDQESIRRLFVDDDLLGIINFLDKEKNFNISSKVVLTAIDRGNIAELKEQAKSNLEKEKRIEKLIEDCIRSWGQAIGALH